MTAAASPRCHVTITNSVRKNDVEESTSTRHGQRHLLTTYKSQHGLQECPNPQFVGVCSGMMSPRLRPTWPPVSSFSPSHVHVPLPQMDARIHVNGNSELIVADSTSRYTTWSKSGEKHVTRPQTKVLSSSPVAAPDSRSYSAISHIKLVAEELSHCASAGQYSFIRNPSGRSLPFVQYKGFGEYYISHGMYSYMQPFIRSHRVRRYTVLI